MDAALQPVERRIASARPDQLVVGAVLDQAAAIDGDDAVGKPHRGQPMGNDENSPPFADLCHVLLDDPLALIIERAGRFVEDQDARIGDQRAGDRDALALAARKAGCRARRRRCRSLPAAPG